MDKMLKICEIAYVTAVISEGAKRGGFPVGEKGKI